MSWLRFLSAGRAFNQGKGGLGRYRLPRHGLPQFNTGREPAFKSTVVRDAPVPSEAKPAEVAVEVAMVETGRRDTVRLPEPASPLPRRNKAPVVEPTIRKKRGTWNWTRKFNPFSTRLHSRREAMNPSEPVQTELSLDNVKPVRNDLSDSDLELVAMVHPVAARTEASETGRVRQPADTIWGKLAEKFFDAGQAP